MCAYCFHAIPMRAMPQCFPQWPFFLSLNLTQSVVNRMARYQAPAHLCHSHWWTLIPTLKSEAAFPCAPRTLLFDRLGCNSNSLWWFLNHHTAVSDPFWNYKHMDTEVNAHAASKSILMTITIAIPCNNHNHLRLAFCWSETIAII